MLSAEDAGGKGGDTGWFRAFKDILASKEIFVQSSGHHFINRTDLQAHTEQRILMSLNWFKKSPNNDDKP